MHRLGLSLRALDAPGLVWSGFVALALSFGGTLSACSAVGAGDPALYSAQSSATSARGFCSAFAVVERRCVRCHADPPVNGAPFALDNYASTQVPAPSKADPGELRAGRMLAAVESNEMPPVSLRVEPPVEPLTCEERATLLAWLEDGAPPPPDGDPDCMQAAPELLACDEPP